MRPGQETAQHRVQVNDESGAGPKQPLDSEVHGPHTAYKQTAAGVVPQLQDEALHVQLMPAGLDSGAIGFAAADRVGPGDGDANEDAEDAAQHLAEDNEGDVRRQKAPRTVDKGVQKAAREAAEAAWERHDFHELASLSQAASAGKPKKISSQTSSMCSWPGSSTSSRVFCCAVSMSAKCPCLMC